MSVEVTYKGNQIASFTNTTKTLKTSGTYMEGDVTVSETNVVDIPVFTETWDSNWETLLSLTCDKTFAECRALCNEGTLGAVLVTKSQGSSEEYLSSLQNTSGGGSSNPLWYTAYSLFSPLLDIVYNPSGTITETNPSYFLGTLTVTQNGTYYPENKAINEVIVNVPPSSPNLQAKINVSPTTSSQTITADSGYDGLSSVQINAMPSGTAGTPTASKGSVSNHSVTVTPSVTNTSGYISGGTKTGTAVSVSASELVSGNKAITENGSNIDVTNYATVSVDVSGGTAAISVVDTTDAAGGTIRTITALDISDTTAIASDVASGKYFYTAAGVKTQGTASGGGGGGADVETGTFTGSGGITVQISCDFAPDMIYIHGDLSNATSLRGVVSLTIIKDTVLYMTSDGSQSAVQEFLYKALYGITNYNENNQSGEPYASYSNGTLTVNTVENTSTCRFASGVTYSYKLVGYSSVS